jgi:hypothetical protein
MRTLDFKLASPSPAVTTIRYDKTVILGVKPTFGSPENPSDVTDGYPPGMSDPETSRRIALVRFTATVR